MSTDKKQVLEDIKQGKKIDFFSWTNISLKDLFTVDENNITYFEYACKNHIDFPFISNIRKDITNNLQAMYLCAKYNHLSWISIIENEDIFFEEIEPGKKLIDYICENNVKTDSFFLPSFKKHPEIIDYIIKYKPNELIFISKELVATLLTEQNGIYPVDKYLNNSKIMESIIDKAPNDLFTKYCFAKNNYDLLKNGKEQILLFKLENGNTVIEELLDKGYDPTFQNYDFKSNEILDILVKRNRFDLLYNGDITLLLSTYQDDKTYLDFMIEKQKQGIDMHIEKMSFNYYRQPTELLAKAIIKLSQNNLQGFIPTIDLDLLLHKGKNNKKSIIEHLVEIDKDITILRILPECRQLNNPELAIVLKNLGIDNIPIDIKTKDINFSDEYIKDYNDNYIQGCVSICPKLLEELKELFYNDDKSDKKIIDVLITSYTYLTSENNPNNQMFMHELEQLIEIKKHNLTNFTYTRIDDGAYFTSEKGVCLSKDVISTINHETSHALHYYLSNYYIPDNYCEIVERVRNDKSVISRINEYSNRVNELREKIRSEISKSNITDYYEKLYQGDKLLELSFFLTASKEKQKEKFKSNYHEQVLDTILAGTYSVDEFIKQRSEIEVNEVVDATLRNEYGALIAIGDIIDAIYVGKFRNGVLYNDGGTFISPTYGHGIDYYQRVSNKGFLEMIANYGSIIKSKESNVTIEYLRSIVGDELVDMIKDVYEQKILNSQIYSANLVKEGASHAR